MPVLDTPRPKWKRSRIHPTVPFNMPPDRLRRGQVEMTKLTDTDADRTPPSRWKTYLYGLVAAEVSTTARYCDQLVQLCPLEHDSGLLLDAIECSAKTLAGRPEELADVSADPAHRLMILLNGNLNHESNIQDLLGQVKPKLSRSSRLAVVIYNPYLAWLYALADKLGLRQAQPPATFLTRNDLNVICKLAGYELVRMRNVAFCPWRLAGIGSLVNRLMPVVPVLRWLGFVFLVVLRPVIPQRSAPSLSIVIPARDERDNIEEALKRIPPLPASECEVIFVEGHSSDGTWEQIQRVMPRYSDRFRLSAYQQEGRGKNDAVRLAFSKARGELLVILDADLTVPPELLGSFYEAYCRGLGDMVNGSRLVYTMEQKAMRFLNRLGNIFFAKALSYVLGTRIGDSLCGTKLLSRCDYERIVRWRKDFGDFDPYGDFELLFGAAELALGIVDVPIRYGARSYGAPSISRFRDGFLLLKMTATGLAGLTMGKIHRSRR